MNTISSCSHRISSTQTTHPPPTFYNEQSSKRQKRKPIPKPSLSALSPSPNLKFFSRPTHIQCQLPPLATHTHATNLAHSDSKPTPTSHPNNQLDTMPPSLTRSLARLLHSSPKSKRKVDCHPLTTALGVAEDCLRLRPHWLLPGWIPE